MFANNIKITGEYTIRENGKIMVMKNQITEIFRTDLLKLFFAQSETFTPSNWYVAIGDGTTPAKAIDVALEDEKWRRVVANAPAWNNLTLRQVILSDDNIINFSEIGVFVNGTSMAGSGKLLSRVCFPVYEKSAGSELIIDWTLKVEI